MESCERNGTCGSPQAGGPSRGRTYGPLIKSPDEALPDDTQQEPLAAKGKDS
jgi:hypothetical protein